MERLEYPDEVIGLAMGSSVSVSEEVLEARKVYRELYEKYKEEIRPEYEQVVKVGGLFIVGTERHEARRIDNQLRGRSGRQGDPGESRFFLSLEDDLLRLFGSERILTMVERLGLPDDQPIDAKILSGSIEKAQKRLESENFTRRRNVLNYDDVMNKQRNIIYSQRREVLDGVDLHDKLLQMAKDSVSYACGNYLSGDSPAEWDLEGLRQYFFGLLFTEDDLNYTPEQRAALKREEIEAEMQRRAEALYKSKEELFTPEQLREIERVILLRNVDLKWMDHLDAMDDLRGSVGLNAYAQRNPLTEYQIVGGDMFDEMVLNIREDTIRAVLSATPKKEVKREAVAHVTGEGGGKAPGAYGAGGTTVSSSGGMQAVRVPMKKKISVGPNDPCPCGSGKKYKKCCGLSAGDQ